jgi:uncharacterized repeat protein (TIGR01451 family)
MSATSGGGGGGGGGGGSGSVPNLRVRWTSISNPTPKPGSEVDFTVTVDNLGGAGALQTHLRFTLPPTMRLVGPPAYASGSGCSGTTTIDCNLDYVANGSSTQVKFGVIVSGSGTQTIAATVTSDREADPADNTATATLQLGGAVAPTSVTPPFPAPIVKHVTLRTLAASRRTSTRALTGRFTINEPLQLTLTVSKRGSNRRLALEKESSLAGKVTTRPSYALVARTGHGGTYSFHAILNSHVFVRGARYLIHLTGTNADGKSKTLVVGFTA